MSKREKCVYCGKVIVTRSKEHIIQNAIGGCDKCYAEYMQENQEQREREKIKMQEQEVKTTKQSDTYKTLTEEVISHG